MIDRLVSVQTIPDSSDRVEKASAFHIDYNLNLARLTLRFLLKPK